MPDPLITAGVVATAYKLAPKVLGPTADYLGERLLDSVKAAENVAKVLSKALKKLGSRADEPGTVPARVVKEFLNEAPFAEDEFMAEYISGVLASSRTPLGRDDTAAAMLSQVGRLSTFAIRAHFVLYVTVRQAIAGTEYEIGVSHKQTRMFVPWASFARALGEIEGDLDQHIALAQNALFEVDREALISGLSWGDPEELEEKCLPESGILFYPTPTGVQLFMLALGFPLNGARDAFHERDLELPELSIPYEPMSGADRYAALYRVYADQWMEEKGVGIGKWLDDPTA